jgi:hypothetical protein
LPVLHFAGIGIELGQIPPQEHLSVSNLCVILFDPYDRVILDSAVSRAENPSGDVVFQQLLVHQVYDSGDDSFDVPLTFD